MSAGIIDVHTHVIPPEYRRALERTGRTTEDGFPCPAWSTEAHRAFMEQAGIRACILSVSSPHQMLGSPSEGLALTRQINDSMAMLSRSEPERFRFAACLPLPMVQESVDEACRALDESGAVAVKLPTNADGLYPGDSRLDPLMDVLNERSAVILLHPCKPPAFPTGCFTAKPLPLFEFLGDTTRSVINLLTRNVAERWPNVRYVVPHMGSFLPPLVDRLAGITDILAAQGMGTAIEPRKALDRFYFDLAGNALDACIAGLLTVTDPDHLLFGGDYPYTPAPVISENIQKLRSHPLTTPRLDDILRCNAEKLFRLR